MPRVKSNTAPANCTNPSKSGSAATSCVASARAWFDDLHILDHAQQLQSRFSAGLRISEHVASSAEFQIGLCDFSTIQRALNHVKTAGGITVRRCTRNQESPRISAATTNAPSQLVQLRKSVPIRVENHDGTGFRNVHADLNYRGRHQNRRYTGFKIGHNLRFCGAHRRLPGQCREANALKLRQRLQTLHDFCDGMQRGDVARAVRRLRQDRMLHQRRESASPWFSSLK